MTQELAVLSADESALLQQYESVIKTKLASFIEVGEVLSEIRDQRLYRATHRTFEDYCRQRWGMSRIQAHRLISAADAVEMLPTGNKSQITTERQARELARVEPQKREEVVARAVEVTGGKITAQAIKQAAVEICEPQSRAQCAEKLQMSEAEALWIQAKCSLDTIRANDPKRETVLRKAAKYIEHRIISGE